MKTETQDIYTMDIATLDLHPLAETTPMMTQENYEALKLDIEANGQLEPISLYRGRIIDGRHRWLILQELGETTIKAIKLPNNTTKAGLASIVRSKETRRHETPTQLAISAYKMMLNSDTKLSASAAAERVGTTRQKVSNAKHIADDYGRMDILDLLFNGDKIDIGTPYDPFKTDSLPAIESWLKENKSKGKKDPKGKVEMSEEQFLECADIVNQLKCLDIRQIKHISNKLYGHVAEIEEALKESEQELLEDKQVCSKKEKISKVNETQQEKIDRILLGGKKHQLSDDEANRLVAERKAITDKFVD